MKKFLTFNHILTQYGKFLVTSFLILAFYSCDFGEQVKDHKPKKVKELNPNPFVHSENVLLAESSFVSGQDKPSVANGYALEWTEKIDNMSPSQDTHAKVGICGS